LALARAWALGSGSGWIFLWRLQFFVSCIAFFWYELICKLMSSLCWVFFVSVVVVAILLADIALYHTFFLGCCLV
jgi:hypothetical protein